MKDRELVREIQGDVLSVLKKERDLEWQIEDRMRMGSRAV